MEVTMSLYISPLWHKLLVVASGGTDESHSDMHGDAMCPWVYFSHAAALVVAGGGTM
jgi:hypothetical protein